MGGSAFNPLSLSPALWLKADAGVVSGGARQFTAANSETLSSSAATFNPGDVDCWWAGWFYRELGTNPTIWTKWSGTGANRAQILWLNVSTPRFQISGDGTASTVLNWGSAVSSDSWHFFLAYHDSVNDLLGLSIDGGAFVTTAHSTGINSSTADFKLGSNDGGIGYWDGRQDSFAFGKSPTGGFATTTPTSIRDSLYNSDSGKTYADLTSAEKTAWGLVSFYDLNELSGNAVDRHGSNTLTDNNTVTAAQGKMEGAAQDSDPVITWQDQSGNGRHVTQSTGSRRATLKLSIQNSLPVVRSDGTDDALASDGFTLNQPATFVLVGQQRAWTASDRFFDGANADTTLLQAIVAASSPQLEIYAGSLVARNSDLAVGAFGIVRAVFNGASSSLTINSGTPTTGNPGANNFGGVCLFAANSAGSLSGAVDIGEFLAFDYVLSAGQLTLLEGYLRTRWGTP